jgi:hypothetical protein
MVLVIVERLLVWLSSKMLTGTSLARVSPPARKREKNTLEKMRENEKARLLTRCQT